MDRAALHSLTLMSAGQDDVVCIVVVDDQADIRVLVTQLLEDEGYRVLSFGHPLAVTTLSSADDPPELFLIDIMMPDMDGITLARRLRYRGFAKTPKVAMSASQHALAEARGSNQFDALVEKPFDIGDFLHLVTRYIAPP